MMSKHESADKRLSYEFRQKMESIRKEKQKFREAPPEESNRDALERIQKIIMPLVESFVAEDKSLEIQHRDLDNIFIAYGYSHVCRIGVKAQGEIVRIELQVDSGAENWVYSGTMIASAIKKSLKDSLLEWYNSIF